MTTSAAPMGCGDDIGVQQVNMLRSDIRGDKLHFETAQVDLITFHGGRQNFEGRVTRRVLSEGWRYAFVRSAMTTCLESAV